MIRAKVFEQERLKVQNERRDSRNKQIGTGDRSEKIRTYNYPQVILKLGHLSLHISNLIFIPT